MRVQHAATTPPSYTNYRVPMFHMFTDLLTMGLRATFGAALLMATVGLIHTTQQ